MRNNYDSRKKKNNYITYITFFVIFVLFTFFGCSSTNGYTDPVILEHQRRVIELTEENKRLRETANRTADRIQELIDSSNQRFEDIRRGADSISDSIDRVIYLFGEYESEVQRLLREANDIRTESEAAY